MKATAIAHSNIALVKYWGNRDNELILPNNSSISMTLDKLFTTTTVEFSEKYKTDSLKIDGQKFEGEELERVSENLDLIREKAGKGLFAKIVSKSNFPKAAGLASSASAFAALALAASKAIGLDLDKKELSMIARHGSGSASRSIHEGFVEWHKGTQDDGSDSYTDIIAPKEHWEELRMIVTVLTTKEKKVKSRAGMAKTVDTSPLYKAWLETIDEDLKNMGSALARKDFTLLGKTAEMNALKMHATMITTDPHIIYWEPETIVLMKEVMALREEGIECYFTMDGGPQVKIICLEKNVGEIEKRLKEIKEIKQMFVCKAGDGARLTNEHLF
jgi:diphosphomevalonate decarboxylase